MREYILKFEFDKRFNNKAMLMSLRNFLKKNIESGKGKVVYKKFKTEKSDEYTNCISILFETLLPFDNAETYVMNTLTKILNRYKSVPRVIKRHTVPLKESHNNSINIKTFYKFIENSSNK